MSLCSINYFIKTQFVYTLASDFEGHQLWVYISQNRLS